MEKLTIIQQIRSFNRFYTSKLGILNTRFLGSDYSLTEGRILFEIDRGNPIARDLTKILAIDEGYLSRIIAKLEKKSLISRKASPQDRRKMYLHLTAQGTKTLNELNERSDHQIETLLASLRPDEKEKLFKATITIKDILDRTRQTGY